MSASLEHSDSGGVSLSPPVDGGPDADTVDDLGLSDEGIEMKSTGTSSQAVQSVAFSPVVPAAHQPASTVTRPGGQQQQQQQQGQQQDESSGREAMKELTFFEVCVCLYVFQIYIYIYRER